MKNRRVKKIFIISIAILLITWLTACSLISKWDGYENPTAGQESQKEDTESQAQGDPGEEQTDNLDNHTEKPEETPLPAETEKPKGNTSIRIRAVGDIMMHSPQIPAGKKDDGTYDFRYFFEEVKPYLEDADITIGNLETTIGDGSIEYSGYPLFRTPKELVEALKYAGFDVLSTANNHSFDGREFGVVYTLEQLDAYGMLHTGTARSMEERNSVLIIEENEIKTAILAYTYGTNGMEVTISDDKLPYMVNYIDKEKICEDISRGKKAGADVIIAVMHWGNEYQRTPDKIQKELADFLFSEGVDVILGSHPHVIQPMEKRQITMDDGSSKEVFVIYSLGNFISNQYWQYSDSGVIVDVEIIKNHDTGKVTVGEVGYIPTWVQRVFLPSGKREYRVLPVGNYLNGNSLDSAHQKRINEVWNETTEHIGAFKVIE